MLQLSPSEERMQMLFESQTLKAKNEMLKVEVELLKTQRVQEPVVPRHKQEPQYQHVLVGLHNIFMFYEEDEEAKGIDEMEQPMQDLPPSPLNEPQDFEEQAGENKQGLARQTLKERV